MYVIRCDEYMLLTMFSMIYFEFYFDIEHSCNHTMRLDEYAFMAAD